MNYGYDLYIDGVLYPVTPSKVTVKTGNHNKTLDLINQGEVNVVKEAGLQEVSFDLLLPNSKYPFARYPDGYHNAGYYIELLRALKIEKKVFQFILGRTASKSNLYNTNLTVTLEELTITDDTKEGMDAKASLKLKEWRSYGTKTITLANATATITEERTPSSNEPSGGTTYTVQKGDCLWKIAKMFYGNSLSCGKIVNANPIITNPNLIYPGQVLVIPDANAILTISTSVTTTKKVNKSSGGSKENAPFAILNSSYGIVKSNIQSWSAVYGYYQANGGSSRGWKIVDADNYIVSV